MDEHDPERAHRERAIRVADHVGQIAAVLDPADPADPADIVDAVARRILTNQCGQLAHAARRSGPVVLDIVRPAMSELVLLRYLCQLLRHDANALLAARARIGLADDPPGERSPSVPDRDDTGATDHGRATLDVLADLGHRLGWAIGRADRLGGHAVPSERWMAAAVGELHLLDELHVGRPPADTSATTHQLAWGSVLLCRTATAARQLVRSNAPLPAARHLVDLITECAAELPAATRSPRPLAS